MQQSFQNADMENEVGDETLLDAIAQGNIWAMEMLYTRYHRLLYSLAYRMVSDHHVAEDLLQDTFIAVWKRSSTYSPQAGAARNWLISIVHHRAVDHLRKMRRRGMLAAEAPLEQLEIDEKAAVPDVWDTAWQHIQSSQVHLILLKIPPEQRQIIELAYFRGWTHSEIAKGMKIPLGTVKARMRLGLRRLKCLLEEMGFNEF